MDFRDMWPGNFIHQTAIIDNTVKMGRGNYVGPYTVIGESVVLGDNNRIEGHASIGSPAEHKEYFDGNSIWGTHMGSGNVIREFVTVNSGTTRPTIIGNNCILLRGSHHSHDSMMEDDVTLSCNVLIGGHGYIMKGAVLGLGAITHQYQIIGAYAMLGMGTIVTKGSIIQPGHTYVGNPARKLGLNQIGLDRNGVDMGTFRDLENRFWTLKGVKHGLAQAD